MFELKLVSTLHSMESTISIHHMFELKSFGYRIDTKSTQISIHHMFELKSFGYRIDTKSTQISIHHMFELKIQGIITVIIYILNFNTSYV